jgi:hypothetical protein
MNLNFIFTTAIVASGALLSDGSNKPLPRGTLEFWRNASYSSDTIVPVKPDPVFDPLLVNPNLANLKKGNVTSLVKYIAIGGKLSAGYRDGGLYRQGQLTAYPNLIAHQMGLSSFKTPLFDKEYGNGTGYLIQSESADISNWKKVKNNTAVTSMSPLRLLKYAEGEVDNLSFPEGPIFVSDMPDNYAAIYPAQRNYITFFNRILPEIQEGKVNLFELLAQRQPDLCTYETHFDEFLGLAEQPINLSTNFLFGDMNEDVADQHLTALKSKGTNLVLFTIPQVLDLPYFHIFTVKDLHKNNRDIFIRYKNNHINPIKASDSALLLPTENVSNTFRKVSYKGLSFDDPFDDEDVISEDEVSDLLTSVPAYNDFYVRRVSKKFDIPMVDLERIYKRIIDGKYISDDGLAIDGSFPKGNFFSSDGRTPSAVGQAVIANETIKVINSHYKTNIPLINISEFRRTVKN